MLKLSTKGRYGTRVMLDLAKHYGQGYILLKNIADREEISHKYLEQILPLLKSNNLVKSSRGAYGGYKLSRRPSQITIMEILRAVEGNLSIVECVDSPEVCDRVSYCISRTIWKKLKSEITTMLKTFTLQDLISEDKNIGKKKSLTYQI